VVNAIRFFLLPSRENVPEGRKRGRAKRDAGPHPSPWPLRGLSLSRKGRGQVE